jgi:RNA polymerase sigma factor (sigma-70 family)
MCLHSQPIHNKKCQMLQPFELLEAYLTECNLDCFHHFVYVMEEANFPYPDLRASNELAKLQLVWMEMYWGEVKKQKNRKHFDHAVQALFDSNNPESITFCASITRMLRQYRLSGTYDAKEIISEAYARGIIKIEQGVFIQVPLAWLRRTCLNVTRDFKRKQIKIDKPKLDGEAYSLGGVAIEKIMLNEDLKAIRLALEKLSVEDQNILQARIFQGLSWQEIGDSLLSANALPVKPGTARQRGSRALVKLRQHYERIRTDVQLLPSDDL